MKPKFDLIGTICSPKWSPIRKAIYVFFEILAFVSTFWLIFCPICTIFLQNDESCIITPISIFRNMDNVDKTLNSFVPVQLATLAAIVLMMLILSFKFIQTLFSLSKEEDVAKHANTSVLISIVTVIAYTLFAFAFSPVNIVLGGISYSKVSYGPLIIVALIMILYAIMNGIFTAYGRRMEDLGDPFDQKIKQERKKQRKSLLLRQLELLGFTIVISSVSLLSLLSDIIKVKFEVPKVQIPDLVFSGKELIFDAGILQRSGEKVLAYLAFVMFFVTCVTLFLALVAFCSRSTIFRRMAITAIITGSISCLLVGLFGQYYRIVQTLNTDIILDLLSKFQIDAEEILKYKITSRALIYFYIVLGLLSLLFARRPYSKAKELEKILYTNHSTILASSPQVHINGGSGAVASSAESAGSTAAGKNDQDPCPAFTALDAKEGEYRRELERQREALFQDPTLPNLVNFIVTYARNSRLRLSYTDEAVATFLAGLGTTRLTILQGMSGTGKTSLPKIVSEALYSVCDIVEVESSWRDKNELLGYYNEFSKIYTPKKFTQALYRAKLNSDTITFIVLDEMNLSRIEYYFSDFLSLMENEPDKREIKLLNVPIARTRNGEWREYKGLVDGTTLKIPPNVWFIGTANRDESTYDISDKVYDRAHTMNFDKRAEKPSSFGDPLAVRYLPASELIRLFENAKESIHFGLEQYTDLPKVEELLQPYSISFGNRIAVQIEAFVSIYAACFPTATDRAIHDALDTILLSKVVKKLELKSVDDKLSLAEEFAKLRLTRCSQFIKSLKED